MKIIQYDEKYKNLLINMISEARVAIGVSPKVRNDLYDIKRHYLDKGDMFWIVLDENDSVIGCLGYSTNLNKDEATLHRFYIKAERKRKGIGTFLLNVAKNTMKSKGIKKSIVHLGAPKEIRFESYSFYSKNSYKEYKPRYMVKDL